MSVRQVQGETRFSRPIIKIEVWFLRASLLMDVVILGFFCRRATLQFQISVCLFETFTGNLIFSALNQYLQIILLEKIPLILKCIWHITYCIRWSLRQIFRSLTCSVDWTNKKRLQEHLHNVIGQKRYTIVGFQCHLQYITHRLVSDIS